MAAEVARQLNLQPELGGAYLACTYGAQPAYHAQLLSLLPASASVTTIDAAPAAGVADPRVHALQVCGPEAICRAVRGLASPLSGALLDLSIAPPRLEHSPPEAALDRLRKHPSSGVPASEWLRTATPAEVGHALQTYGSLHDEVLAARLGELITRRVRDGAECGTVAQLGRIVQELRAEFEAEHANQLPLTQILRARRWVARFVLW